MEVLFFTTPDEMRQWLENNHQIASELWVGYYKKGAAKMAITWQQSVDIAICYGWIDGIRKSLDAESYTNRFTPRRANSNWSLVNIKKAEELIEQKLMRPAGLAAFKLRKAEKSGVYSFEQNKIELTPAFLQTFKGQKTAWHFFEQQAPSYCKTAIHWVMSAKQSSTQLKRLQILIDCSEQQLKIPPLRRTP